MPLPTGQIAYSQIYNYYGYSASPGINLDLESAYGNVASNSYLRQLAGASNRSIGTTLSLSQLQGKALLMSDAVNQSPYASNRPPNIYGYQAYGVGDGHDALNYTTIFLNSSGGGGNASVYQAYAGWLIDYWIDRNNYYYGGRLHDGWFCSVYDTNGTYANAWWRGGGFQAGYSQPIFSYPTFPYGQNGTSYTPGSSILLLQ
jgi:hypothetical protein